MSAVDLLMRLVDCEMSIEYNQNQIDRINETDYIKETKSILKQYHIKRIKKCQKRIKLLSYGYNQRFIQQTQFLVSQVG